MHAPRPHFRTRYALHGVTCTVTCDDADIASVVDAVFDYFGVARLDALDSAADIHFSFQLGTAPPEVPADSVRSIRHNGIDVIHAGDGRCYLRDGTTTIEVDTEACRSRGAFSTPLRSSSGRIRIEVVNLVIHCLLLHLRARRYFPLHAACVAHEESGLMLVAEGDSGKSTQAMRLVRSGWSYLSDDSVLLRPVNGSVEARPLRRDFGLDRCADALFPEIRNHRTPFLTDERKQRVRMASLYPGKGLDRCVPRALVFPRIVDRRTSRMRPLAQAEAIFRLTQQSVLMTADASTVPDQMGVLSRLAEQAGCYELEAGRDALDDRSSTVRLFESCLAEGYPT